MFVKLIVDYPNSKLEAVYKNDIIDENENEVGKFRLVYGFYEEGYLSFLVFFQDEKDFNVYCIEKIDYIIDCTYDKKMKSWISNNNEMSSKFIQCLEKLRKIL